MSWNLLWHFGLESQRGCWPHCIRKSSGSVPKHTLFVLSAPQSKIGLSSPQKPKNRRCQGTLQSSPSVQSRPSCPARTAVHNLLELLFCDEYVHVWKCFSIVTIFHGIFQFTLLYLLWHLLTPMWQPFSRPGTLNHTSWKIMLLRFTVACPHLSLLDLPESPGRSKDTVVLVLSPFFSDQLCWIWLLFMVSKGKKPFDKLVFADVFLTFVECWLSISHSQAAGFGGSIFHWYGYKTQSKCCVMSVWCSMIRPNNLGWPGSLQWTFFASYSCHWSISTSCFLAWLRCIRRQTTSLFRGCPFLAVLFAVAGLPLGCWKGSWMILPNNLGWAPCNGL